MFCQGNGDPLLCLLAQGVRINFHALTRAIYSELCSDVTLDTWRIIFCDGAMSMSNPSNDQHTVFLHKRPNYRRQHHSIVCIVSISSVFPHKEYRNSSETEKDED